MRSCDKCGGAIFDASKGPVGWGGQLCGCFMTQALHDSVTMAALPLTRDQIETIRHALNRSLEFAASEPANGARWKERHAIIEEISRALDVLGPQGDDQS